MISVETSGLPEFEKRLKLFPKITERAAVLALNFAARRARTLASKEIRNQINLTASYLNSPGRLYVSQFASAGRLEAKISARVRPTQLAQFSASQRFARGKTVAKKKAGISVRVKRGGRRRTIRQAFFVRLKRGTSEGGNVGVAVRDTTGLNLRKGIIKGKANSGFRVLYAPSVDQVFRSVREDILPQVNKASADEFDRQFVRFLK